MADLNELYGQEESFSTLEELIPATSTPVSPYPQAAIRNRAATTAFLSDNPEKSVENYKAMMVDDANGSDATVKAMQTQIQDQVKKGTLQGVMSLLSDPNVPFEQKKSVVDQFKGGAQVRDTATVLATEAIIAPSASRSIESEDVRTTSADLLDLMEGERQQTQGLVNAAILARKGVGAVSLTPQAIETMFTPGGQGALAAQVAKGMGGSWYDTIKAFVLPGSSIQDQREKLSKLPPTERAAFSRQLMDVIQNNSELIFTKDNDYAAMEKLQQVFGDEYNDTDKWIDNITNLLDVVGIGAAVRGVYKGARGAQAAAKAEKAVGDLRASSPTFSMGDANRTPGEAPSGSAGASASAQMPEARVPVAGRELQAAEDEYAGLLGDVQTRLEPGDVRSLNTEKKTLGDQMVELSKTDVKARAKELASSERITLKEATTRANKELADAKADLSGRQAAVDQRLDLNASTAEAEKRLKGLEEKIDALRKQTNTEPAALNPLADSIRRIGMSGVTHVEHPNAPGSILMQTNPEKARGAYAAVFKSDSEEVAGGLFGATRQDALAAGILPQVTTESGRVISRPVDMNRALREELLDDIDEIVRDGGGIQFTPNELAKARANVVNDFENASGLTVNDAMSSFSMDGDVVKIGAVYGTPEGGFLRAEDAVEQAQYALRNYGVLPEEITVLQKQGLDHVPVSLEDVRGKDGDFLIRIDTSRTVDSSDVDGLDALDVKRNWFDRFKAVGPDSWGSLQRWVFDASSSLHKTITGSAINAVDRTSLLEKTLLTYASKFSDGFNPLAKDRKVKMFDYIKEANFKGTKQDYTDLKSRGFSDDEIDTLNDWKNFWDGHFYLENLDVVRSLRRDGYQRFTSATDELIAKPITKNITTATVYDPSTQTVRTLSRQELDDLYNTGGTVAILRRPANIGGDEVTHMMVRNTPQEYLKGFRDSDKALNYREGYFQITYKAPKFIEEVIRDANGNVKYTKAIAVAGDRAEADAFAKRQVATNGGEYRVRNDDRGISRDSDEYFDLNSSSGRIAQRHRGKLLEDSSGLNHLGNANFIENPVESAVRAAMSVSGRTISRPVIEASKARFMEQYRDLIMEKNAFNEPVWPSNRRAIGQKGIHTSKEIADAKTTYEYIRYLEDGYINAMDEVAKSAFYALADGLGRTGFVKSERLVALAADNVSPASAAKALVFNAYIASNPLRQWIVQTHQVVRSWSYNPTGWANGGVAKYAGGYFANISRLGTPSKDVKEFIDFVDKSGMLQAIDKSNLVRGTLSDAAGRSGFMKYATAPLRAMRQIGFDVGEAGNLIGHSAAVFEKYKRSGAKVTSSEVRAQMASEVRAITWDMNFAGDMPYNQNWAAAALQFMQVPHKAILQATNRRIDPAVRFRMVAADMVLWGAPLGVASSLLPEDMLPDDPEWREALVSGLESASMNWLLRGISNDDTSIDFTSLAPYDMSGWGDFFTAVWSGGGISEIISQAPAGQLLFKDGGRLSSAVQMGARVFHWNDEDYSTPDRLLGAANEIAKLSSGWNNWQKSSAMLVIGQARDSMGRITDEQTTQFEAIAQSLGFGTSDTRDFYATSIKLSENAKEHKDRSTADAKEVLRLMNTLNGEDPNQLNNIMKVTGIIMKKYQHDPAGQEIMMKEINNALSNPNDNLMGKIIKAIQLPNLGELPDLIRKSPLPEDKKKQALQLISDMQNIRKQDYYKED